MHFNFEYGFFRGAGNETTTGSTNNDPPKSRLAALIGRSLGVFSWSRLRPDGNQHEVALWQGKCDERYPEDALAGEVTLHLTRPNAGSVDAAMVHVATFRHDGVTFHVPVTGGGGSDGRLWSADGRVCLTLQADEGGKVVLYDTTVEPWRWVWQVRHGRLERNT